MNYELQVPRAYALVRQRSDYGRDAHTDIAAQSKHTLPHRPDSYTRKLG